MISEDIEYLQYLRENNIIVSSEPLGTPGTEKNTVLNYNQNWDIILKSFYEDGIVVIDNLLKPEYALRLRDFVYRFNVRHEDHGGYKAISFYRDEGLKNRVWFPLLESIIQELQKEIKVLENSIFSRAWAFIYDTETNGTTYHADPATITLNLWVTPVNSLLKQHGYNGLDIWKQEIPGTWLFDEYNSLSNTYMYEDLLNNKGIQKFPIEYNFNRAVLFNSKYIHKSQPVVANAGYNNKRINYTFLFDK